MDSSTSIAIDLIVQGLQKEKNLTKREIFELLDKEIQSDLTFSLKILIEQLANERKVKKKIILEEFFGEEYLQEISVPVEVFSDDVGSLESLVFYLHEDLKESFVEISKKVNRKLTTIRTSYINAKRKGKRKLDKKVTILIPLRTFSDRTLTVFEAAVVYLKNKGKTYKQIADLLNKDQRNVWSTNFRALTKLKGGKR
jgi:DNA-directed RNA polymerase specialized sigma24 family protein